MMSKERLSIIQQLGKRPTSNSEYLEKLIGELSHSEYSWIIDRMKESNENMPTDYQDSHFYNIIKDSFSMLEETVKQNDIVFNAIHIVPKPIPYFGTVNWDEYNAFIDVSEETAVIVFNNGLLKLTQQLMLLLTKERWLSVKKLITNKHRELLTRNFLDIMMCFYLFSDAYLAIPLEWCEAESFDDLTPQRIYDLESSFDIIHYDNAFITLEDEVRITAYLWMAAHEYSHLLLNHKHETDTNKSWKQELDADLLGAIISMESDCSYFTATGIYFALSCIYMSSFDTEVNSHPPVSLRMKNVFDYINTKKDYIVSNYKVIDQVFVPKIQEFIRLVHIIEEKEIHFLTPLKLQNFIYKEYKLE